MQFILFLFSLSLCFASEHTPLMSNEEPVQTTLLEETDALIRENKYFDAEQKLEEALKERQGDGALLYQLGRIYHTQASRHQKPEEAEKLLDKAKVRYLKSALTNNPEALNALAGIQYQKAEKMDAGKSNAQAENLMRAYFQLASEFGCALSARNLASSLYNADAHPSVVLPLAQAALTYPQNQEHWAENFSTLTKEFEEERAAALGTELEKYKLKYKKPKSAFSPTIPFRSFEEEGRLYQENYESFFKDLDSDPHCYVFLKDNPNGNLDSFKLATIQYAYASNQAHQYLLKVQEWRATPQDIISPETHLAECLQYFEKAAHNGNPNALFQLSLRLLETDTNRGEVYQEQVAQMGHFQAAYLTGLRLKEKDNLERGMHYLLSAALNNHPGAQHTLGCTYLDVLKNKEQGLYWLWRGAMNYNPEACTEYVIRMEQTPETVFTIIEFAKRSAYAGSIEAIKFLANYFSDMNIVKDIETPLGNLFTAHMIRWLEKGVEVKPTPELLSSLGCAYYQNTCFKDREKAFQYLAQAIEAGSRQAVKEKGYIHMYEEEFDDALKCFQQMPEDAEAVFYCGYILQHSKNKKKSVIEANKYFEQAANMGFAQADEYLGKYYVARSGIIAKFGPKKKREVEELNRKSFTHYKKAAESDLPASLCAVGELYMYGMGCDQNFREAENYLRSAIAHGFTDANKKMGLLKIKHKGRRLFEYFANVAKTGVIQLPLEKLQELESYEKGEATELKALQPTS